MADRDELTELAELCAARVDVEEAHRFLPGFSDVEEQCEDEYEALIQAVHEDELFAPVDISRQEELVERIAAALPEAARQLIVELADNHARHVWMQQEAAYLFGVAVGRRMAHGQS